MVVSGFILTDLICQTSLIPASITGLCPPTIASSYKLVLTASVIALWRLRGKNLYAYKNVAIPSRIWHTLIGALGISLSAFIALSLVVKTNPPITWKYLVCTTVIVCPMMFCWRLLLSKIIRIPALASRLHAIV